MKRSKLLFISGIIGTIYTAYLFSYFLGSPSGVSGISDEIGGAIATLIVAPHMILTLLAVIFNWLGFALRAKWAALVAGILYAVAMAVFIIYFMFVIIEMIMCFIAYAKMKKTERGTI